jgi:hypothetical protein
MTNVIEIEGLEHRDIVRNQHSIKVIDELMMELTKMSLCNMAASHFVAAMELGSGHEHPVLSKSSDQLPQPDMDATMLYPDPLSDASERGPDAVSGVGKEAEEGQSKATMENGGTENDWPGVPQSLDEVINEISRLLKDDDAESARLYARRALKLLRNLE